MFAFDLPYEASTSPLAGIFGGNEFELSQKFNLQVESISLLVPVGVKAAGGQNFSDGGTQSMGGGFTFQLYKAGALAAGQTFTAKVSGTPQGTSSETTSTSAGSNQNIIIGIGAFGVALMLAGGFLYLRDRQARDAVSDESDEDDDEDDELSEDDLLDAIIALDDQYKAGNLSEPAYKERRAELKAKLMRNA